VYCVSRCEFEKASEVFKDMFGIPFCDHTPVVGLGEEYPIVLDGYLKADFEALLKVVFPS